MGKGLMRHTRLVPERCLPDTEPVTVFAPKWVAYGEDRSVGIWGLLRTTPIVRYLEGFEAQIEVSIVWATRVEAALLSDFIYLFSPAFCQIS